MTRRFFDPLITLKFIELWLHENKDWKKHNYSRTAYRIILWQNDKIAELQSENGRLRAQSGIGQAGHVDKVMKERR